MLRTDVGDKNVIDRMVADDLNLGGEPSGHLIFRDHSTTGDGLIAALQVLSIMKAQGAPLSRLARCWPRFPQLLSNVRVREKRAFDDIDGLGALLASATATLTPKGGRVFLRYSGTEPKVRLLVEGPDAVELDALSRPICDLLRREVGIDP